MSDKNNVIEFVFEDKQIRTVVIESEVWFVGKDVATVLGYVSTKDMTRRLDEDEKGRHLVPTLGGDQQLNIINEAGLYSAILGSRKQEAKSFKKWVTSVVLPTIRKTGGYMLGEEHVQSEEELVFMAMQVMQRKIEAMKPKAEYHDNWMSAEGSYSTTEVAKKLGITAQKLNKFLREEGIKWQKKDLPKSGYEGWFKVIDRQYDNGFNSQVAPQCRVSPEGVSNIINLYEAKAA